jgi:hypothetical protein
LTEKLKHIIKENARLKDIIKINEDNMNDIKNVNVDKIELADCSLILEI